MLKVIHKLNDKAVDWSKVAKQPKNVFDRINNCNEVVNAGKRLAGVKIQGIGGYDIQEGNKMLILAIVWQLCRLHALQLIGSKTEQDLLNWVSETEYVTAFNDAKFADGTLLLKLCAQVDASVVD